MDKFAKDVNHKKRYFVMTLKILYTVKLVINYFIESVSIDAANDI